MKLSTEQRELISHALAAFLSATVKIESMTLIGSSALGPEEQAAHDLAKHGHERDDRDVDVLVVAHGITQQDAESWAFSEEAEELETFYNLDVQLEPAQKKAAVTFVATDYAAPGPVAVGDTVHFKHDQEIKAPVYAVAGETVTVTHGGRLVAVDRCSIYQIDQPTNG